MERRQNQLNAITKVTKAQCIRETMQSNLMVVPETDSNARRHFDVSLCETIKCTHFSKAYLLLS
jgi:hypothetical protein